MDFNSLNTWISFVLASLIFIMAPGPDTILLLGQGLARGRQAGLGIAIGCALGCCVHTLLASIGVTAILASSDTLFDIFKYSGAAYLFYLGGKAMFSSAQKIDVTANQGATGVRLLDFIVRGFLSNALNPKVALFFLSFLPQFVAPSKASVSTQIILLGSAFAVMLLFVFGAVGYFAGHISQWLTRKPGVQQWLDRLAGATCFALAIRLIFVTRNI